MREGYNWKIAQTLAHNLVDLAVFLSTDKLLVLIGELDLDSNLVLGLSHKVQFGNYPKGRLDCVVGAGNGEGHLVIRNIRIRIGTDVAEHCSDIIRVRKLPRIWLLDVPSGAIKLPRLSRKLVSEKSSDEIHVQVS